MIDAISAALTCGFPEGSDKCMIDLVVGVVVVVIN
jgi:hypothetical protein